MRDGSASGIAAPAMAPMAAGPAPVRKPWARVRRISSKWRAPTRMKRTRGRRLRGGQQPAADTGRGVADDRHGLHDRPRRDLAQRHRVEELRVGHPVVVVTASGCISGMMTKPPPKDRAPTLNATQTSAPPARRSHDAERRGDKAWARRGGRSPPDAAASARPQPSSTRTSKVPERRRSGATGQARRGPSVPVPAARYRRAASSPGPAQGRVARDRRDRGTGTQAAPVTHIGGWAARNSAASAKMAASPGR